ncbi:MAG: Stp1/IreP family PP2C-type Ser/Thr phosphatase [Faecalicoccus sp.]|nr:Stp1/IreP family PP2C-type Ser/Thr phosphatase [Faecalicoccus sp.]
MRAFANTDVGSTRKLNEDDYCVLQNENNDWLAVVCDGIGGAAAGEVASHLAISILRENFLKADAFTRDSQVVEWIDSTLHIANDAIYAESMENKRERGMGTTCVGVIIANHSTYIFNVGDSRIYADYDDGFIQMSEDHSVIGKLMREGKISEEEAKTHSQRNVLTNALGIWHVFPIDTNKIGSDYHYLLLCSDGLHGYVDKEDIEAVVRSKTYTLQEKVNILISKSLQAGGYDNCTVILLENDEVHYG